MVAFAIGGLLGDTLLHLIPGSFLGGEDEGGSGHGVEFVIKNDQRNLLRSEERRVGKECVP